MELVPAVLAWPMQVCSQLLQHGTCFVGSAGNNSRILGLACFYMSSTVVSFLIGPYEPLCELSLSDI